MTALAELDDPIVAVATAPGRGAVGIVRASGADLAPLALALTGKHLTPRHAHYGPLLGADGEAIDQGLALYFPAPHSYTGEDVLELQAHGGPVVLDLLLAACLSAGAAGAAPRLRLAQPGEFTQRAFLNGKLDLAQAEAVADLIDAATTAAAKSASRALAGAFSAEVTRLADGLVALRLLVEATLDFPEEEIDFLERADARGRLAALQAGVAAVRARARQGQLLREGLHVVLAGQPNVGKSSLLNALAGAEVAIVTPVAGTTRDRVRETLQIDGVPIHLVDTAGLRSDACAADDVERIGMARTWEAVADADAVLFVHDLSRAAEPAYAAAEAALAAQLHAADPARVLHVHNKADLAPGAPIPEGQLRVSTQTGEGLPALRQTLLARAGWLALPEGVTIARGRHLHALDACAGHLAQADALAAQGDRALDLLAEELRQGHEALQAITGQFSADDLLGEIFGHFCIGK